MKLTPPIRFFVANITADTCSDISLTNSAVTLILPPKRGSQYQANKFYFLVVIMAFQNIEVEVKIKLENKEINNIRDALMKISSLKKTSHQIDIYYAPKHENYLLEKFPFKWFSIRQRDNKSFLNFKHFFPEKEEKHSHSNEYETEVSNYEAMRAILNELDIMEIVTVDKIRETYLIDDMYEIVLDMVKDLGNYLEIEALKLQGDIKNTRNEMINFLNAIGIMNLNIDYRGYPYQLLKLKGVI